MSQALHTAKIIITNDGEPILNGALLVEDGKIAKVGSKDDFSSDVSIIDHGNSIICPGFINLHTHLLYTNANNLNCEEGLFPWIKDLITQTNNWGKEDYKKSVQAGIKEVLSSGTTTIVENTPSEISVSELSKAKIRSIIGIEIFGSNEEDANQIFNKALNTLENYKNIYQNSLLEFTLSPHASYDVSHLLWEKINSWSLKTNSKILTHLEESPQESKWWQEKSGPAISLWENLNVLEPKLKYWKRFNSGIEFLNTNGLLIDNLIATHLSSARKEDLITLKKENIALVHCPRSNSYLNCGIANIKEWDEIGLLWGLGTDSKASNINLNLVDELKYGLELQEKRFSYKISEKAAFETITCNAGKIINKKLGAFKKGYFADFLVFNLDHKHDYTQIDPYYELIWNLNSKNYLREAWVNGEKSWISKSLLHRI